MFWELLQETCKSNRLSIQDRTISQANEQTDADREEKSKKEQMEYIKERLDEVTIFIDRRIESVIKLAQEEQSSIACCTQTDEFLEQLIEQVQGLSWLLSSIPLEAGRYFWQRYREGFYRVIEKVEGVERIWWSIRRGYSGIPRNRDYSTSDEFKNFPSTSLEDARSRWDEFIDQLKCTEETFTDPFESGTRQSIRLTWYIFKKIKLKRLYLNNGNKISVNDIDCLIDCADPIVSLINDLRSLLSMEPPDRLTISGLLMDLNTRMHELITIVVNNDNDDNDDWFQDTLKKIDSTIEEVCERNPQR